MRKNLPLLAILFVSVITSCVDKAYDLQHISDNEITVGGDIPIPLANIEIILGDLFDFSQIPPSALSSIKVPIPAAFDHILKIDTGFDLSQSLGESGETTLKGNITSPLPFAVKLTVTFTNGDAASIAFITDQLVAASPATTQITAAKLTKEQIDFLDKATAMKISFVSSDGQIHEANLDPQQSFKIFLSILKKGGIKL